MDWFFSYCGGNCSFAHHRSSFRWQLVVWAEVCTFRALGPIREKALHTFESNHDDFFWLSFVILVFSSDEMLLLLVQRSNLQPAKRIFLFHNYKCPFLALCMMGNNVIRAEGKAKFAMVAMIIPLLSILH
jgi:hypothetical protein